MVGPKTPSFSSRADRARVSRQTPGGYNVGVDENAPQPSGADPGEVEPTDNSTGDLVDLERVDDIDEDAASDDGNP